MEDPHRRERASGQGPTGPTSSVTSAPFVQVCDRCRWKKIKCDGAKPCGNCRASSFPCETRARLSKQATPRSYVQYLEARIKQLESQKESEWSPRASSSRQSPYGPETLKRIGSPPNANNVKSQPHGLPDWTTLNELGTHVVDEEGLSRYMGPSSGVGFTAKVLQEVLDDDQPTDAEFYCLFNLDDSTRGRALADSDVLLWHITPTNLPDKSETDRVIDLFFLFTERVFPVLHGPTFRGVVNRLYSLDSIPGEAFEALAQLYLALSIGYCFDMQRPREERIRDEIHALQTGCRCHVTGLHARRDGLTRLQTLALHSYALILLRQRSEGMRISAMANVAALDVGLHHDGKQFKGNPLETEMRRRVFWCVFMLHLFNSSLQGLPRALHEADITIAEPSDIDDEQLTSTEVLNSMPGRTKIHRFVSVCRLARILSRVLDVLYTHNKRKKASSKIEQMHRLCCEHLLDQLDFSSDEIPDDLPGPDSDNPADMAILASYANEVLLYHYIRLLISRPGLAFHHTEPQFASCLHSATEAAAALTRTASVYRETLPYVKFTPGAHPLTIFLSALTPLYRTALTKSQPGSVNAVAHSAGDDYQACQDGVSALSFVNWDNADKARRAQLERLIAKVFGNQLGQPPRLDSNDSRSTWQTTTSGQSTQSNNQPGLPGDHVMNFHEQRLEHLTAHDDLRNFVHEAFSPTADPWAGWETFGNDRSGY